MLVFPHCGHDEVPLRGASNVRLWQPDPGLAQYHRSMEELSEVFTCISPSMFTGSRDPSQYGHILDDFASAGLYRVMR